MIPARPAFTAEAGDPPTPRQIGMKLSFGLGKISAWFKRCRKCPSQEIFHPFQLAG